MKESKDLSNLKTVEDLQYKLSGHRDAGLAMQIIAAIKSLVGQKEINEKDELSPDILTKIWQKIHNTPDPMLAIMGGLYGGSKNPMEAALAYIEDLKDQLNKQTSAAKRLPHIG